MLVLPENFNSNEWFITVSIVFTYTFMLILPKRFPLSITVLMLLFSYSFPIYLVTLCIYLLVFLYLKDTFEKLKRTPINSDSGG